MSFLFAKSNTNFIEFTDTRETREINSVTRLQFQRGIRSARRKKSAGWRMRENVYATSATAINMCRCPVRRHGSSSVVRKKKNRNRQLNATSVIYSGEIVQLVQLCL